jgi:pimeloyl-ACP methyl ester carboxylesterase
MNAKLRGDAGSGMAVVYVPGIDGTGDLMLGLEQRLERAVRLIRVCYDVDDEGCADTYEALAASVAEVVRSRGVERCLVIAESFGGAVALQLALSEPQLVAGLMVVNSFAYYSRRAHLALMLALSPFVTEWTFNFARKHFAPKKLFGRSDPKALADFQALPGVDFDEGYLRRARMIQGLDLRPKVAGVTQPVALFAGDKDQVVPSVRSLGELQRLLLDATLEVLPGGGHVVLPLEEEPWLERVFDLAERAGFDVESPVARG